MGERKNVWKENEFEIARNNFMESMIEYMSRLFYDKLQIGKTFENI